MSNTGILACRAGDPGIFLFVFLILAAAVAITPITLWFAMKGNLAGIVVGGLMIFIALAMIANGAIATSLTLILIAIGTIVLYLGHDQSKKENRLIAVDVSSTTAYHHPYEPHPAGNRYSVEPHHRRTAFRRIAALFSSR